MIAGPVAPGSLAISTAEARPARGATSKASRGKASKPAKTSRGKTSKASRGKPAKAGKGTRAGRADARRKRSKGPSRVKLCKDVKVGKGKRARNRKRCSFVRAFSGRGVVAADLRTTPLERPSGDIWVYSENLREEARVNIYRPDGAFDEAALARLDDLFRCKRTNEVRALDPRLYEQLSRMQDHFQKPRATVVSGFRFAERASSRHFHAAAIDIKLEGVGLRDMHDYAKSLDAGGMGIGIYPHSGFIHLDFRAPGEPSYRWTDYSGPGSSDRARRARAKRGKAPGRTSRAKRPNA